MNIDKRDELIKELVEALKAAKEGWYKDTCEYLFAIDKERIMNKIKQAIAKASA